MPDSQNTPDRFLERLAARRPDPPVATCAAATSEKGSPASEAPWHRPASGRWAFFVFSALILIPALGLFAMLDAAGGHSQDSFGGLVFVSFLLVGVALARQRLGMTWLVRIGAAVALALIGYETYAGLNEGVTFVWIFTVPTTVFFLVGDREGAFWAVTSILVSTALLLGVVPGGHVYAWDVTLIFTLTFSTVCILSFILESSRRRLARHLQRESAALRSALEQVEKLRNLMPICARCKSVRDDRGYWHEIESYLLEHTRAELEPAFCPGCAREDVDSVA